MRGRDAGGKEGCGTRDARIRPRIPSSPQIAASGIMDYQHPVVPMTLPEGRWLKATTFRVSDRQVVHHILSGTVDVDH